MYQLIYVGSDKHSIKQYLPNTLPLDLLITRHVCIEEFKLSNINLLLLEAPDSVNNNLDWLKAFKSRWPSIPVLIIGDTLIKQDIRKYYRAGIRDYLLVPDEGEYLSSLTERLLKIRIADKSAINCDVAKFPLARSKPLVKPEKITDKAIAYININFQKRIKVDDLAKICNMHPNTFARKFKDDQCCTIREYIKSCRINAAMQLLRNTKQTIENIAFNVGFETVSLFNRLFKQMTGVSPSKYRQIDY